MSITEWTRGWAESKNLNFRFFPTTDSTNNECKRQAFQDDEDLYLCFADHQTGGRGRFERRWLDHGFGSYLLSSWSYRVKNAPHPLATGRIGLATVQALESVFHVPNLALKVPNDIYIGGKKAGGILTESVSQGHQHRLIVGLGLNVLGAPNEEKHSTSLASASVKLDPTSWFIFLDHLADRFSSVAQTADQNGFSAQECEQLLRHLNRFEGLKDKYISLSADGVLKTTNGSSISWLEL